MSRFRNSGEIRKKWLLFRRLAIGIASLGIVLLVIEILLALAGWHLDPSTFGITVMIFSIPVTILWIKSRDLALWLKEELELEELARNDADD